MHFQNEKYMRAQLIETPHLLIKISFAVMAPVILNHTFFLKELFAHWFDMTVERCIAYAVR